MPLTARLPLLSSRTPGVSPLAERRKRNPLTVEQLTTPRHDLRRETAAASLGDDRAVITLGELGVLSLLVMSGIACWVSLALAHVGHHDGYAVVMLSLLAFAAVALLVRALAPIRIETSAREIAAIVGVGGVAAVMFFPGFPYAVADKDPGVYVTHGAAIARTGSFELTDPVLDPSLDLPNAEVSRDARFPGIWIADASKQRVVPQFFHLLPAAMATAKDVAGDRGVFNLVPIAGLLAVLALMLALRRAVGWLPALLGGVLLPLNMMEVWGAKYPATEILFQAFAVGAMLAVVIALKSGWAPAAACGGVLTAWTFLARPDGLLLVLFAIGVGAALFAVKRFDKRAGWFGVGLAIPLPHALLQAYSGHYAGRYTADNGMPGLRFVGVVVAVLAVGAFAVRKLLPRFASSRLAGRFRDPDGERTLDNAMRVAGMTVAVLAAVAICLAYARPWLTGAEHAFSDPGNRTVRTFSERSMERLTWFFTIPGIAIAWVGLAVTALRRWNAAVWTLLLPGLLLVPLYVYDPKVASRMMWWTRRFTPVAVVTVVVLIAIGLSYLMQLTSRRGRALGVVVAVFLAVSWGSMSWPLRSHKEFAGTLGVSARIAASAGPETGVFLWERSGGSYAPSKLFGGPVWLRHGQISAPLPPDAGPDAVERYRVAFPGRPVFVVAPGPQPSPLLAGLPLEQVDTIIGSFHIWEEPEQRRPSKAIDLPYVVTIWRLRGT